MKTLILGISMFITGFIGFAILCGAAVVNGFSVNNSNDFRAIWRLFGVTHIANSFLILGIIGVIIVLIGLILEIQLKKV